MAKKTAKKKVTKKKVLKKKLAKKTAARRSSPQARVQDYANEIWLAGLGAFALAQEEGGNIFRKGSQLVNETTGQVVSESSKLFERLVTEGAKLEGKGRKLAAETVEEVRSDVEGRVGKARQAARTNWDKLEKVFEERVARALSGLGVPTSEEIQRLSDRVQELNVRVRDLAKTQGASAPAASKKKAARKKGARKKAARKKKAGKTAAKASKSAGS